MNITKKNKTNKMKKKNVKKTYRNNVSREEIYKCSNEFCKDYLSKKREESRKRFYNDLPKEEQDKMLDKMDTKNILFTCNRIYCNPYCSYIRKNLPERYFYTKKDTNILKKKGAITYCQYDL